MLILHPPKKNQTNTLGHIFAVKIHEREKEKASCPPVKGKNFKKEICF